MLQHVLTSGVCPKAVNGVWKVAVCEAITRSQSPSVVAAVNN